MLVVVKVIVENWLATGGLAMGGLPNEKVAVVVESWVVVVVTVVGTVVVYVTFWVVVKVVGMFETVVTVENCVVVVYMLVV